mmetsp:Transcript_11778/g.27627  ORF Transcript_11778/g.27627 Transcript_11778/m.27627 type:complete len:433 (-) Transcript_11778:630-1928(-)
MDLEAAHQVLGHRKRRAAADGGRVALRVLGRAEEELRLAIDDHLDRLACLVGHHQFGAGVVDAQHMALGAQPDGVEDRRDPHPGGHQRAVLLIAGRHANVFARCEGAGHAGKALDRALALGVDVVDQSAVGRVGQHRHVHPGVGGRLRRHDGRGRQLLAVGQRAVVARQADHLAIVMAHDQAGQIGHLLVLDRTVEIDRPGRLAAADRHMAGQEGRVIEVELDIDRRARRAGHHQRRDELDRDRDGQAAGGAGGALDLDAAGGDGAAGGLGEARLGVGADGQRDVTRVGGNRQRSAGEGVARGERLLVQQLADLVELREVDRQRRGAQVDRDLGAILLGEGQAQQLHADGAPVFAGAVADRDRHVDARRLGRGAAVGTRRGGSTASTAGGQRGRRDEGKGQEASRGLNAHRGAPCRSWLVRALGSGVGSCLP